MAAIDCGQNEGTRRTVTRRRSEMIVGPFGATDAAFQTDATIGISSSTDDQNRGAQSATTRACLGLIHFADPSMD